MTQIGKMTPPVDCAKLCIRTGKQKKENRRMNNRENTQGKKIVGRYVVKIVGRYVVLYQ